MEIKVIKKSYREVMNVKRKPVKAPKKPNFLFRTLLKLVSLPDLWATNFKCKKKGMDRLAKNQPCLILMNHSSFIDLEIASSIFYPRPLNIVATWDGYIGKNWLMRELGCIQTKKFTVGAKLLRDMKTALTKQKSSVLMYPEAGYSFDGTATTLPESIGKCVKMLGVPLVTVITHGAFLRQPLYNELIKRKLPVCAEVEYLLSLEEIEEKSAEEINALIQEKFSFDDFRYQFKNQIKIDHSQRAQGLNRVLYKCPNCLAEGQTIGADTSLTCKACKKEYELTEYGKLRAVNGETEFEFVSDWYAWERKCVREEIESGKYSFSSPVKILVMVDSYHLYDIGTGQLTHGEEGFFLRSDDGELEFTQSSRGTYSINADFYWYQLADAVCVGDLNTQYYCFPKCEGDVVAKLRLAAEELFKIQWKK